MTQNIVFEISQEEDGGFVAECLSEDIFTQADNWEELKINVTEAVKAFYYDQSVVPTIKLH
jgi:predicted RNase H-like HicB family nuclease